MDNIIEYMTQNRGIKNLLTAAYNRLETIKTETEYHGQAITETSDIRPQNKHTDNFANYVALIEDVQNHISDLQKIHVQMIRNIMLLDYTLQDVIEDYYINGLSVSDISRKYNFDSRTFYRKKKQAAEIWRSVSSVTYNGVNRL